MAIVIKRVNFLPFEMNINTSFHTLQDTRLRIIAETIYMWNFIRFIECSGVPLEIDNNIHSARITHAPLLQLTYAIYLRN